MSLLSHFTADRIATEALSKSDFTEAQKKAISGAIAEVVRRYNRDLESDLEAMKGDIRRAARH